MDPSATIAQIKELLTELRAKYMDIAARERIRSEISDLLEALGDWLHGGGFCPVATGPILGLDGSGQPISVVTDHPVYAKFVLSVLRPDDCTEWQLQEFHPYSGTRLNCWRFPCE